MKQVSCVNSCHLHPESVQEWMLISEICWKLRETCLSLSTVKNVRNLNMSNSEETFLNHKIHSSLEIKYLNMPTLCA